jgi:hypothetical protein
MMLENDGILTQYGIDITNTTTTIINNNNKINNNIIIKKSSNDTKNDINKIERENNFKQNNCFNNNNILINDTINNAKLIKMTEWELSRFFIFFLNEF